MREEMLEEIKDWAMEEEIETEEEVLALCEEMEDRWRYRYGKAQYRVIESVLEEFKEEFFEVA